VRGWPCGGHAAQSSVGKVLSVHKPMIGQAQKEDRKVFAAAAARRVSGVGRQLSAAWIARAALTAIGKPT
jgi:hypothetical protein